MTRRLLLLSGSTDPTGPIKSRCGATSEVLTRATVRITASAGASSSVITRPRGHRRRTVITRIAGTLVAELPDVAQGDINLVLNDVRTSSLTAPTDTASTDALRAQNLQEVSLWRGNQLLLRGPVTRPQVDQLTANMSVSGPEWYLTRRLVGRSPRQNYVRNPDFEQGLRYWGAGADVLWKLNNPGVAPKYEIVGYPTQTGSRAIKLTIPAGAPKPQVWIYQRITFKVPADVTEGEQWSAVAYCYIPAGDYIGPAESNRLLTIVRGSTTEPSPYPAVLAVAPGTKKILDVQSTSLDDSTPRNQWVRQEATLHQPLVAGEVCTISIQCSAIEGVIFWDHVTLHRDEKLRFRGVDQTAIIAGLVDHAQDPTFGKSDVALTVSGKPGKPRDRVYAFDEHANIWDSLIDFTKLADGVDLRTSDTPTTRTLNVYTPRRARRLTQFRLIVGGEATTVQWTWDGQRAASTSIVLGDGSSAGRDEGQVVTTAIGPDAVVLETVEIASPESRIDGLDQQAQANLDATYTGYVLEFNLKPDSGLVGVLFPGDLVIVQPADGDRKPAAGWYRIVSLTIHPDDSMSGTANQEAT